MPITKADQKAWARHYKRGWWAGVQRRDEQLEDLDEWQGTAYLTGYDAGGKARGQLDEECKVPVEAQPPEKKRQAVYSDCAYFPELWDKLDRLVASWMDRRMEVAPRELRDVVATVDQPCHRCGESVPAGRRWPVYRHPTCFACLPPPPPLKVVDDAPKL